MADHHVVIDNLVKTYPGAQKPSVDHVSFSLPRGEMLALLAPRAAARQRSCA
uniref:hypothetical protein n=1 Tax=Neorhizobium sp. EC2-8 TaxID=3129230 RepID=UPI003100FAF4